MGINSRSKGKRGELELSHYLTERGFPARRGQQFKGGSDSPDVVCDRLAELGYQVECKRVESLNIHKAMAKACDDCENAFTPIVAHRKNGTEWLATLPLDAFLEIIGKGRADA